MTDPAFESAGTSAWRHRNATNDANVVCQGTSSHAMARVHESIADEELSHVDGCSRVPPLVRGSNYLVRSRHGQLAGHVRVSS